MEHLKELVAIVNKRKLSQIEILDKSLLSRKDTLFSRLYEGIASDQIRTDEEAMQLLYPKDKNAAASYRKLKSRFKERLLNTLYFIDINHTAGDINSKKAYFDCVNKLYLSNILLRYAENRQASVQLIIENYPLAKKNNFFDILKEYAYKLMAHYGLNGQEKKYNEAYEDYLYFCKEYDLEQKAQLIYTRVLMVLNQPKKTPAERTAVMQQAIDELKPLTKASASLVTYFMYTRVQLFYFEYIGDYTNINHTCDRYLKEYRKYLYSILSENYLNTIYIYKLKSLYDLRNNEEALQLIETILPFAKGLSYLAVKEFEVKIYLQQQQTAKAGETIAQLQAMAVFKQGSHALKERWIVYTAYTEFLQQYLHKGQFKFGLARFLNNIPLTSLDKSGFNVAARIITVLFYLGRNDLDHAVQQIEALKVYQQRHLKEAENLRSTLFIRLLGIMEKHSFNYKELKKPKEYIQLKEQYARHRIPENEIIPYDMLWEITLDILYQNDMQLLEKWT